MDTLFPCEDDSRDSMDLMGNRTQAGSDSPWKRIKERLREMVSIEDFRQWVEPLVAKSEREHEIVISLPDMLSYQKVLDQFLDQLDDCKEQLGLNCLFRFEVDDAPYQTRNEFADHVKQVNNEQGDVVDTSSQNTVISRAITTQSHLNPEYRFENFVNGPSNQFAHASCLAVADDPGQNYNPLFLYGSTGLGKTHLLHAVGNAVLERNKEAKITYISSERFMNEMIYCLRFNKMWDFRRKYRNSDVLLVDDIQFISGKERTQEEFFHTFNALYESKNQIIVTSDVFPRDIPDIEDRLRNRFQWGLIADIQPPDIEHRVAILMSKAEKQRLILTPDAAEFIAIHAKGSVRVLEGALSRVEAHGALQGRPLDLSLATEVLQGIYAESQKQITVDVIQKTVADHFKLRISDLKSKKRQRTFSLPRQIAMYLARTRTKSSFPDIGEKFGGKDHTTVMHAFNKIKNGQKKDLDLRTHIETIDRRLDQIH